MSFMFGAIIVVICVLALVCFFATLRDTRQIVKEFNEREKKR
jgi:hypothetical protein